MQFAKVQILVKGLQTFLFPFTWLCDEKESPLLVLLEVHCFESALEVEPRVWINCVECQVSFFSRVVQCLHQHNPSVELAWF